MRVGKAEGASGPCVGTASERYEGGPEMAVDQPVCQRHGRPAVAERVRLRPDGTQEVEYLCEIDLAEERLSRPFGGRGLFDDFFSDFFGDSQTPSRAEAAPQRRVERVDVTQYFSDATRELLR